MKLTKKTCDNAKPKPKAYKLADGGGLYLQVSPQGGLYWRLKYRFGGKEKLLALGTYPLVSLAEARDKRDTAKKHLLAGIDPSSAKQEEKRQNILNAENTFEVIAREWHQHNLEKWSDNHAETILRRLEMDVFPSLGKTPIKSLNAPDVLKMVRDIEKRGAHEMARRTKCYPAKNEPPEPAISREEAGRP